MDLNVIVSLIFVIAILLIFTIFVVLVYSGLFAIPTVRTGKPSIDYNCVFAYQFLRGPYSGNDVGAAFTLATAIAPRAPSVGIFYDDPQQVPEHELRCAVGCLISREEIVTATADSEDIVDVEPGNTIVRRLVDEREEELLKKKSFRFCQLPRVDLAVVTELPYTTPFSIWLAPSKVYPRLSEYISSKNLCAYPMIEFYADNRIYYMAPLSKQDDFFVPEAKLDQGERHASDHENEETKVQSDDGSTVEGPSVSTIDRHENQSSDVSHDTESDNVVRRRNVQQCDHIFGATKTAPTESPSSAIAAGVEHLRAKVTPKRKDSSDSSSSSSFEKVGVDELK